MSLWASDAQASLATFVAPALALVFADSPAERVLGAVASVSAILLMCAVLVMLICAKAPEIYLARTRIKLSRVGFTAFTLNAIFGLVAAGSQLAGA
ncbi:hypothetical protein [Aquipuribacter sp. MA13-13]